MPSDLQRVARGLVECLDEVPQVVAHLLRTAGRCRENAALAMAASQGTATVAAMQLDAAARACEEAAHYLEMAPPKAKAWAERLVGESRSSDRPDAGSADRNKATGGVGDVAIRDDRGRIKQTSAPLQTPKEQEPPLIKVARKALESWRKRNEDADQADAEPLEVEIHVDEAGKATVVADERDEDEHETELKIQRDEAAAELLKSMAEPDQPSWRKARLTIDDSGVTATFEYDEEPAPAAIVVPPIEVAWKGNPDESQ